MKRLLAYYSGKVVDMHAFCGEALPDLKRRFSLACARVTDNARAGYVLEGERLYSVAQGVRTAKLVRDEGQAKIIIAEIEAVQKLAGG